MKNRNFFFIFIFFLLIQSSQATKKCSDTFKVTSKNDKQLSKNDKQLPKDFKQLPENYKHSAGNLRHYLNQLPRMDLEKMAMMSFYLPYTGKIVDMGVGPGKTTHLIAQSYPFAEVTGVDIDPEMVERAIKTHQSENLNYIQGDIAQKIFPENSLNAIINSSVIHHVTSFSGEGYDFFEGVKALSNHIKQLKEGGLLILRDFVIPKGPFTARLKLRIDDGQSFYLKKKYPPSSFFNSSQFENLLKKSSTFQKFQIFSWQFRSSVHKNPVPYKLISENKNEIVVESDFRTLVEFMYHKDYVDNWASEVKEEYLYMSQNQLEDIYKLNQMRILFSRPIYTQWVYDNRFKNKLELLDTNNQPLPLPPTKLLIIAEKVKEEEGVQIYEQKTSTNSPQYLKTQFMKHKETQETFQIIERPLPVIDVIPYFQKDNKLYVINRQRHPRGIINANLETPHLRDAHSSGYVNEPIVTTVKENESKEEALRRLLVDKIKLIDELDFENVHKGSFYFPSEGLIGEQVFPYFVRIDNRNYPSKESLAFTEAEHALRAFQVGGSFDTRMEINLYRLLKKENISSKTWIGEDITLSERPMVKGLKTFSFESLTKKQSWEPSEEQINYATIKQGEFVETNGTGFEISREILEYAVTETVSHHTLSFIPAFKSNGIVYVGLELRDLPVPQIFDNNSIIPTISAFRIPKDKSSLESARKHAVEQLEEIFSVKVQKIKPLGLDYRTSMGITPEIVYPFVAEVIPSSDDQFYWIPLKKLLAQEDKIKSAHLLTSLFRLNNALQNGSK